MLMSHMIADTPNDLHGMAQSVGLKRSWFQSGKNPHYDLCQAKRAHAIKLGAIVCDRKTFICHLRRVREVFGRVTP